MKAKGSSRSTICADDLLAIYIRDGRVSRKGSCADSRDGAASPFLPFLSPPHISPVHVVPSLFSPFLPFLCIHSNDSGDDVLVVLIPSRLFRLPHSPHRLNRLDNRLPDRRCVSQRPTNSLSFRLALCTRGLFQSRRHQPAEDTRERE